MERALRDLAPSRFDLGILDSIFMTHYLDLMPARTLLQEQNIESQVLRQYAEVPDTAILDKPPAFWKASSLMLEAYENRLWPRFALRMVVSDRDRQEMDRRCTWGTTLVVENGVHVACYAPVGDHATRRILLLGSFDYPPNVDAAVQAARHVMPLVWARMPDAELCIAGRNPPLSVRALASRRVVVHASPPDVAPLAARAALSLVPLRMGGGTRIKILESFAWGVPVVSTALGCQGLRVVDNKHLLVRNSAAEQADAVTTVLTDARLWVNLREAGRRLVAESYDWETVFRPLDPALADIVTGAVAAPQPAPRT